MSASSILRLALGGLGVILGAVIALWSPWDGGAQRVDARFDSVDGLVVGAEVRSAGVEVGAVESIALEGGLPRVTLRIDDDDAALRRGARAEVRMGSLSGVVNRIVSVDPGTGPLLGDGALIDRDRTDQPVEVDDVLSTLDPATRRDVTGVLAGLRRTVDGRGEDIGLGVRRSARALRAMGDVLADVTADGPALRELVRGSRQITQALAARPGATAAAVAQTAETLDDAAAQARDLRAGVDGLPGALAQTTTTLGRLRGQLPLLRATVGDLGPAAVELQAAAPELRTALAASVGTLDEARRLVGDGPADLRAIRPLLPAARATADRLTPTLRAAMPVLDETRVRLPDVFSFFANWADFTANYDANGNAARVGLVLPPAPLSPASPDANGPGHLPAPFVRTPGAGEDEPWTDFRDSFLSEEAP